MQTRLGGFSTELVNFHPDVFRVIQGLLLTLLLEVRVCVCVHSCCEDMLSGCAVQSRKGDLKRNCVPG